MTPIAREIVDWDTPGCSPITTCTTLWRMRISAARRESLSDVGAADDTQWAFEISQSMAKYLVELGFNLDFAPVADVVNGAGQTMARRSFGTDAQAVAQMVEAAVRGFTEGGILCCAKHFPGIGSAEGDPEVEPIRRAGDLRLYFKTINVNRHSSLMYRFCSN